MPTSQQISFIEGGMETSRTIPGLMRVLEWKLTSAQLLDWIKACMDMGITTFDHADIYGSYQAEAVFGAALKLDRSVRENIQLVTKCGIKLLSENRPDHRVHAYDTSREHILKSVETSLRNFHTDYLDMLLVHRPDPLMDVDEIAAAFAELGRSGKVKHFGVSNFTPSQFELLFSRLDFTPETNQIELSVTHLDPLHDGTLDTCQKHRIAPMIWSPLGGGHLFYGEDERSRRVRAMLERIAGELDGQYGIDQIALAWVMKHPTKPVPVLGTGKLERIAAAVEAESIQLTRDQWFMIWEASAGHEVP